MKSSMAYLELLSLFFGVIALVISIIAVILIVQFQKSKKMFFSGKNGAGLENFIVNQNKKIKELSQRSDYIEEAVKKLEAIQKLGMQKIGIVRYNSLNEDGGHLSFSLAIMDASKSGVVITSMHGREQNRIYAKPIRAGKSDYVLTEEEQKAINQEIISGQQAGRG